MATTKTPQTSRFSIRVQTGLNAAGKAVVRQRVFKNVKPGAADADVHEVAKALAALQQHPVLGIARLDEGLLDNV